MTRSVNDIQLNNTENSSLPEACVGLAWVHLLAIWVVTLIDFENVQFK